MQYFVSAENSSYFYWQLELLIESFLMHGIENSLVIGLAENNDQKVKDYSSNLVRYGKKFIHSNEGRELDYLPMNRVSALRYALAYDILKPPFVLIHSDMILRNPIILGQDDKDYGIIVNNYEDISTAEEKMVKEQIEPNLQKLAEEREVSVDDLPKLPFVSAPIIFNEPSEYVLNTFFSKLQVNLMQILKSRDKNFPCEQAAWELTLTESFQHCGIKGKFLAASLLHGDDNLNFIHYKNGIPPVFNKKFYQFEQGTFYSSLGPYETLMEHNPTVNTNYLQQVIRSYKRRYNK
jgi:hypothetical protein